MQSQKMRFIDRYLRFYQNHRVPKIGTVFFEISHISEGKVPKVFLRSALVKIWRKAEGVHKDNADRVLQRGGFMRLGPWWFQANYILCV